MRSLRNLNIVPGGRWSVVAFAAKLLLFLLRVGCGTSGRSSQKDVQILDELNKSEYRNQGGDASAADFSEYLFRIQNSAAGSPECKNDFDAFVTNYRGSKESLASDLDWIANYALEDTHDATVRLILARHFENAKTCELLSHVGQTVGSDSFRFQQRVSQIASHFH